MSFACMILAKKRTKKKDPSENTKEEETRGRNFYEPLSERTQKTVDNTYITKEQSDYINRRGGNRSGCVASDF